MRPIDESTPDRDRIVAAAPEGRRPGARRTGQAPVEIVFALLTALFAFIPLWGFFGGTDAMPRLDENGLYAEIMATRLLEDCRSWTWKQLEEAEGKVADRCLDELFRDDKRDDWYIAFKEYRRKLGVGKDDFRARRLVRKVADGLMAIEVKIAWGPLPQEQVFSVFCLRRRTHQSLLDVKGGRS